ncbi:MAG: putative transcriptional regulator [Patescibacteria group bacterium]|jgi:predicted transcriptional regulator
MAKPTPQEIQVWYLIPALKKVIAQTLKAEHSLNQKQIAEIFGATPAAISHYIQDKRGNELTFSKEDKQKIQETALKIKNNPKEITKHLYQLSKEFATHKSLCDIHKQQDKSLPKNCKLCLE